MKQPLDKYYTDPIIAEQCTQIFSQYIKVDKNKDIIIEPSAGNGSFIPAIKAICKHPIFIDIEPEHPLITKADYLRTSFKEHNKTIYVLGNPPFGFKSSLAIKFIRKSCQFCNALGFILPKSFANQYMQKSIPLNFHLLKTVHLPENSFSLRKIRTVFQVWEKRQYLRKKEEKLIPSGYNFVSKRQHPHFAIRRVGHHSGSIITTGLTTLSSNSHYFAKLKNPSDIRKIHSINPPNKYNVTGQICISKRTIIKYLNKMVK